MHDFYSDNYENFVIPKTVLSVTLLNNLKSYYN